MSPVAAASRLLPAQQRSADALLGAHKLASNVWLVLPPNLKGDQGKTCSDDIFDIVGFGWQRVSSLTSTLSLLLERVGRPPVVFFVARQRLLAAKLMLAWHVLARHVHCFCHSSKTKSQQAH
ncbi:unnamed protein product [Effrenium voratum]|uniref:Uncharacterized protein n=1 Tax=Effrenium voratum TaxID=2562239 RepID=A0AA36N605_9DINO|nr:unnamed protein product [Effrenium voratum]